MRHLDLDADRIICGLPRKRALLLLRWTLFASLLGLGMSSRHEPFDVLLNVVILIFLFALNAVLTFLPAAAFRSTRLEFSVGLLDTALLSVVVYGADPTGRLCLSFFLLLAGTAIASRVGQILFVALALSGVYLLFHGPALEPASLLVIPLFYSAALNFGYQVLDVRDRQARADQAYRERQELRVIRDVLESITSSLDFHTVMSEVVQRMAEAMGAIRCSVVLLQQAGLEHGCVVATSDDRGISMLPIQLDRYPEIRLAIQRRRAVLIEDVEKSAMLQPFLSNLRRLHFRSLAVVPILYGDEAIGTLFLRAARARTFEADELRFCRAVASAAASAIRNARLHDRLKDRAREREALAARLQSLFDHSPDSIFRIDDVGRIREVNRAALRRVGLLPEEMIGMKVTELLAGMPPVPELRRRAEASQETPIVEARRQSKSGRRMDFSVAVGLVTPPAEGLILIARDVTEQKRHAAESEQRDKLSRIGEIVAGVAHELNNPLAGVVGFAQLLRVTEHGPEAARQVERIIDSANRCQKIVQGLLGFARPTATDRKPLGLNGLLEKTLDLQQPTLDAQAIEVVKELAPGLPYVMGDFHQLQQVFTNLITNAQHAMSAVHGRGRLAVRTFQREREVVVSISDDGGGIPEKILPRIFDPFFSTKKQGSGTGLGLSISYGIVRDHRGELLVDTVAGRGTTFTVVFPALSKARPAEGAHEIDEPQDDPGRRILAVDDEPVIVDLYMELLRSLGHSVDTASTGEEALRKLRKNHYDLVITDIKMPKLSGVELFEKVIADRPRMASRFIFITGDMNYLNADENSAISGVPCLLKPLDLKTIEGAIHDVLGGDHSHVS